MFKWRAFIFVVVGIFLISLASATVFDDLTNQMVGYWNFGEGPGTIKNVHNTSIRNFTSLENTPGWSSQEFGSGLGSSMQFNASDSDSTGNLDYNSTLLTNFSWSFWFNSTSPGSGGSIVEQRESGFGELYVRLVGSKLEFHVGDGSSNLNAVSPSAISANLSYFVVVTVNNTGQLSMYLNNDNVVNTSFPNTIPPRTTLDFKIGATPQGGNYFTGWVDEIGYWGSQLTPAQANELWNGGSGLAFPSSFSTTLSSPTTNLLTINSSFNFSSSFIATNSNLTNSSLQIWYSNTTLFNQTTNTITGITNTTLWNIGGFDIANYLWNVYTCGRSFNDNSILCSYAEATNRTFLVGLRDIASAKESTVFETASTTYNVSFNVSSGTPTANLWWNGTSYAGTATSLGSNNWYFSRDLVTATGTGTKNVFWEILLSDLIHNDTLATQTVSLLNMSLCGSPYTVAFANFTFKDEATSAVIGAFVDSSSWTYWIGDGSVNKSFSFANATGSNLKYSFCFTPPGKTVNADLTFKYSNTSYPQRTFTYTGEALTNATIPQVLYLLGSGDGIYSSIQIIGVSGNPITGVSVTIERELDSVWVTTEQGNSDSSGLVTFWVNPNYNHRITATKTGYITQQVTIRPSQSLYTMTMQTTSGNASYVNEIEGVRWLVSPSSGPIDVGTYNFNATVTSTSVVLEFCKLELLNAVNISQVLATVTSTATNSSYCYAGVDYTTVEDLNFFGRLSIDTAQTTGYVVVDADWKWITIDIDVKAWRGISGFFSELKTLNEFGDTTNTRDFSRFVFFFLLTTIFIGIFTYFSGFELQNPGVSIFLIAIIIIFASAGGFLSFDSGSDRVSDTMEQWGFLWIFIILTIGYTANMIRRHGE